MPELADRAGPNAGRNRLAVLLVVALLQALVLRAVPEAVLPVLAGLVRVAEGIGLFLRGGATGGDRGPGVRLRPTLVRDLVALGVGFTAASDPRA